MDFNITTLTDSYKIGHYNMYLEGTQVVHSYFESRKGARFNNTVFFGLQYLLKEYLYGVQVTKEKIAKGKYLIGKHLGPNVFNEAGWNYILNNHGGKLPVLIKAVPEGCPVPTNNVLMNIENTDEKCYWLTNYLETLLNHVWASSTVATLSREIKILCKHYLDVTSNKPEALNFMLHDFGYRGVSSVESAGICGAAHLVNFMGTDTIRAIEYAMEYYASDVCAYSVPATEHSIMTSLGPQGEMELVGHLLDNYPEGILSIVIDSYDYEEFIKETYKRYGTKILHRKYGKVVFRPDSGEPVSTTLRVLDLVGEYYGTQTNIYNYKVLNSHVGVLWGDGIEYLGVRDILHAMKETNWSAENIVFGMGGGLLQKINRDVQRFAFKCSAQKRNGVWYDIYKKPQDISKMSKKGRLGLLRSPTLSGFNFITKPDVSPSENFMVDVFRNGEILKEYTFSEVRTNAKL